MNGSIVKYFQSPTSGIDDGKEGAAAAMARTDESAPVDAKSIIESNIIGSSDNDSKSSSTSQKKDVDRLIAENMASVLRSLKKKHNHRCSKRKKNSKKEQSKELSSNATNPEDAKPSPDGVSENDRNNHSQSDVENIPGPSMLQQQEKEDSKKKLNAFQVMMNSRNKVIGSNSPGKEETAITSSGGETPDVEQLLIKEQKAKRKLKLEAWADQKASATGKRKLQEIAEGEYINHQLNRRAKRLKKLFKNMKSKTTETCDDSSIIEKVDLDTTSHEVKIESTPPSQPETSPRRSSRRAAVISANTPENSVTATPTKTKQQEASPTDKDFLRKLNSPIKRKDSLLGYFAKIQSPPQEEGESGAVVATTKRTERGSLEKKQRRGQRKAAHKVATPTPEQQQQQEQENLSPLALASGRPRRSCVGKVKDYAILAGTSPPDGDGEGELAMTPEKKKPNRSSTLKSSHEDATPPARSVKLAPLFVKKPVEDPAKVRARQEFLMSGIPEKMRVEIEKQRSFEEAILNESPVFPLVSHVQQLPNGGCGDIGKISSLKGSRIKIRSEASAAAGGNRRKENLKKLLNFEFGSLTASDEQEVEAILVKLVDPEGGGTAVASGGALPVISNVKTIVREWKQSYSHFPVFRCYKQFKAVYEAYAQLWGGNGGEEPSHNHAEDILLEASLELVLPKLSYRNGDTLFTEKYKPRGTEQILINCQPAVELHKFLASWKREQCDTAAAADTGGGSSSSPYEGSNSSSSWAASVGGNCVVLVGPTGSGKTCSVYAVATELGFKVLELNASSRRKGKKILHELQEATQSHQVRRKTSTPAEGNKQKYRNDRKQRPVAAAVKAFTTSMQDDALSDGDGKRKVSLILIEDADVVFEQDEGFVAAMHQLISTSKRPIVLTTSDPNCAHLARYISSNAIFHVAAGISHVAKLLSIMALVERVYLDESDVARLYAANRKDLRKTLNELQFFIQSGGDRRASHTAVESPAPLGVPSLSAPVEPVVEPAARFSSSSGIPPEDDEASRQSTLSSLNDGETVLDDGHQPQKHRSLFRLFSENQNHPNQLLPDPIDYDNLWCNMVSVLREGSKAPKAKPQSNELSELVFMYENISCAAAFQTGSDRHHGGHRDRLLPRLEDDIAHELVEASWDRWFKVNRTTAGEERCCYDRLKRIGSEDDCPTISSYLGMTLRTRATLHCDTEPLLRVICRSERERSRTERRRGGRFYHYFRNFTGGQLLGGAGNVGGLSVTSFSMDHFDALSCLFEEEQPIVTTTTTTTTEKDVTTAGQRGLRRRRQQEGGSSDESR